MPQIEWLGLKGWPLRQNLTNGSTQFIKLQRIVRGPSRRRFDQTDLLDFAAFRINGSTHTSELAALLWLTPTVMSASFIFACY
jgi:hypothetical protein